MIHSQADKTVVVIKAVSVATDATSTGNIDLLGYDYCSIDVSLDSAAAVSSNPAVLKVSECDTTVVSSFADITAFVGDGTGGFVVANSSTDTPQVTRFDIDTKARKRYLKLSITSAGAAQLVAATARLSRAGVTPSSGASSSGNHVIG